MKKSLLALAVFGAFAGVASAQTSVTVYGVVDMGISRETGGTTYASGTTATPAGSVTRLGNGMQSGTRLGFKGTEDLGGGLKAMFQLETGINADTGGFGQGNLAFGRQSWVGLNGGFGTVSMGRQYSATFIALDEVDPFGTGLAGNSLNLFTLPFGNRNNNTIKYVAPEMGGFSAEASYGFGEVAGDTSKKRTIGGSVGYTNGPVLVKLSYEKDDAGANAKDTSTKTYTITNNSYDTSLANAVLHANDPAITGAVKHTQLTGSYNFNVATLALAYRQDKDDSALDAANMLVGVTVPFGASSVMASYVRHNDKTLANRDAHQIGVGYTYALSKRTNFYSSYARITNNNGAVFAISDASAGGTNEKAFNVGIRHKF